MTFEEKLIKAIEAYEQMGNTVEELGALLADATAHMPQRGWYSDEFVRQRREEIHTAQCRLRQLPYGDEILEYEKRLARC